MKNRKRLVTVSTVVIASLAFTALTVPAKAASEINVLMVGNPQMKDLQTLTAENFTKDSGIKVNFTILPENELRDKVTLDVSTRAGQYDVVTIGMYEVANWAGTGKIKSLDSLVAADPSWNKADIFPSMINGLSGTDKKLYAAPFYGESSMLMYRKDLAKKAFDTQLIMNERLKNENELLKLEPELYGKDAKKAYELKQRIDGTKRTLYSCELYGKILHYPEQEIIDFKLKVIKMKTDAEEELSKLTAKPVRLDNQEWLYNIDKAAPNSKYTLLINEEDEREVLASKLITSMVEALGHTIVIKHDPDLVLDSRQSSVSSPESDPQSLEESTDDDAERRSLNCR